MTVNILEEDPKKTVKLDKQQQHKKERKRKHRILMPISLNTEEEKMLIKLLDYIIAENEELLINRSHVILDLIRWFVRNNYYTVKSGQEMYEELKDKLKPTIIKASRKTPKNLTVKRPPFKTQLQPKDCPPRASLDYGS